jgi:hypothetical protein
VEFLEHVLQVFIVLLQCGTENKEIIKVDMYKDAYCIIKDNGYKPLESARHIAIALLHDIAFVRPKDHSKTGLVDIFWLNAHLFICIGQVYLRAELHSCDIHPDLVLIQEQSHVLHHIIIALAAVDDCSEFS